MLAIIILMIIAIILGGLAAFQLYAVTQTQNLLIQSQKNMSSIAMWKTMLISKAKAVGYENEIVLPYGDNAANYQTPPKWVYFNTKNPWGKDIIYCPLSSHNSGTVNNTVAVAGGSYGVETKNNFATVFNGSAKNYVISSNQSFGVNTTGVLAFLISPTPSTGNQIPSCSDITFDTSDNIYKVANGLVDIITKGDVETFANLSMLAAQNEGTSSSSSAYLTTIEGDSSSTGNTFNANLNYIISSEINYARIKVPSGNHTLSSLNLGDLDSNYDSVRKTLIIEGEADGSSYIVSPSTTTITLNNYNLVLINIKMYDNILITMYNSTLKTMDSTIGNISLKLSDWFVLGDTNITSSNLSENSVDLRASKLSILNDNLFNITEKSGNSSAIDAASSTILVDQNSKIIVNKKGNVGTIFLVNSNMTVDRGVIETNSTSDYDNDILVDDASTLTTYNSIISSSGRSQSTIGVLGTVSLVGSTISPKRTANVGISLFTGAKLIMRGVSTVSASIGTNNFRFQYPVVDENGSFAGGLPSDNGGVTLYATATGACATGNLFGYSKSNNGTGQSTINDYDLINDNVLSIIVSKLNASNWICNKL